MSVLTISCNTGAHAWQALPMSCPDDRITFTKDNMYMAKKADIGDWQHYIIGTAAHKNPKMCAIDFNRVMSSS
jgi:hypothetical protein